MRNILIALAALATLIIAGNALAAKPEMSKSKSILIQSSPNMQSAQSVRIKPRAQTMINTEVEAPVVDQVQAAPAPQHNQAHQGQSTRRYYRPQKRRQPNFFEQLMDLERRKNAWLKKTFLGI